MAQNFNIGFLKTVQQPIIESLKKARDNIVSAIGEVKDKNAIGTSLNLSSIEDVHSAKGALQMIDLPGVVLVLSKLQELLKQTKDNNTGGQKIYDSLNISLTAVDNIIIYIEQLSGGEKDRPMRLFDDYQKINHALGKDSFAKDLFFPKLDILKPEQKQLEMFFKVENNFDENRLFKTTQSLKAISSSTSFEKSILEVCELVSQVKSAYEASKLEKVTGVLFIQSIQDRLTHIKRSINSLIELKINKHYNTIFTLYLGFVSCLEPNQNQQFPKDYNDKAKEIKFNLLKLSAEVRYLLKELEEISKLNPGEMTQAIKKIKSNKDVQKELLYSLVIYLVERPNLQNTPENKKLNNYIDLTDYLDQLSSTQINATIAQKDSNSVDYILKIWTDLKEEFKAITDKDQKSDPSVFMKKFHSIVAKFNEQIHEAGFKLLNPAASQLLSFIVKITTKQVDYNNLVKEELSFSLNFLDKVLNTHLTSNSNLIEAEDEEQIKALINRLIFIEKTKGKEEITVPIPKLSKSMQKVDKNNINAQAFEQLLEDMVKAESILEEFFKSKGANSAQLVEVTQALNAARGVLQLTGKKELANIAKKSASIIEQIGQNISNVKPALIKKSNDQIASIILYAQAMKNQNEEEAQQILTRIVVLNKEYENQNHEAVTIENLVDEKDPITGAVIVPKKEVHQSTETSSNSNSSSSSSILPEVKKEFIPEPIINIDLPDLNVLDDVNEKIEAIESTETSNITETSQVNEIEEVSNLKFKDVSDKEELGDIFVLEAEEVLENLYPGLEKLRKDNSQKNVFVDVKRCFHTLKGSGRMVDYKFIGESAWLVEQTLNQYIELDKKPDAALLNTLEQAAKIIEGYVAQINESEDKSAIVDLQEVFDLMKPYNKNLSFMPAIAQLIEDKKQSVQEEVVSVPTTISTPASSIPLVQVDPELEKQVAEARKVETVDLPNEDLLSFDLSSIEAKPVEGVKENIVENIVEEIEEPEVQVPEVKVKVEVETEISEPQEEPQEFAEVTEVAEIVEPEEKFVLINNQEIDKELYSLYQEESAQLLEEIDYYFANKLDLDSIFVRKFHTLSSIAKSVNLKQLASLSQRIEHLVENGLEKQYQFSPAEIEFLDSTFDLMKEIQENHIAKSTTEYNEFIVDLDKFAQNIEDYQASENNVDNVDNVDNIDNLEQEFEDLDLDNNNFNSTEENNMNEVNEQFSSVEIETNIETENNIDNVDALDNLETEILNEMQENSEEFAEEFVDSINSNGPGPIVEEQEKQVEKLKETSLPSENVLFQINNMLEKQFNKFVEKMSALEEKIQAQEEIISEQAQVIEQLQEQLSEQNESFENIVDSLQSQQREMHSEISKSLSALLNKEVSLVSLEEKISQLSTKLSEEQKALIQEMSNELKTANKQIMVQGIKLIRKDIEDLKQSAGKKGFF